MTYSDDGKVILAAAAAMDAMDAALDAAVAQRDAALEQVALLERELARLQGRPAPVAGPRVCPFCGADLYHLGVCEVAR